MLVVEGGKCVDALHGIGLHTVTSPHGVKSARHADWTPVCQREVVILPDNDATAGKVSPEFALRRASEFDMCAVRWLWPGRVALGTLTLLAGEPVGIAAWPG